MRDDFAIFVLSNNRAKELTTVDYLIKCGYTGKYYILLDDEDGQIDLYKERFGEDKVIIFNKESVRDKFDIMDNFEGNKVPTFARNALADIAKDMGLTYFSQMEDDHQRFVQRYTKDGKWLRTAYVTDLDSIIDEVLHFLDISGAVTVCFSQYGDLIGGVRSSVFKKKISRKAMNSFFTRVDRAFEFKGRFNDDVNSYIDNGKVGKLMFTISDISLWTAPTQVNSGGITDLYKKYGTYVKSWYSVMLRPDCVKISEMGESHKRIHHLINWETCVPKIVSGRYKK